jgi:hypothetical protein
MTHGALHRVLTHEPISFRTHYALNVVGQKVFEIHTKHRYFSLPAAFVSCSFFPACPLSEGAFFYASLIATTFIRLRIFANSIRPRLILDLTVPSGIFNRSTISA